MNEHALWADLREVVEVKEAVLEGLGRTFVRRPRYSVRELTKPPVAAAAAAAAVVAPAKPDLRAPAQIQTLHTFVSMGNIQGYWGRAHVCTGCTHSRRDSAGAYGTSGSDAAETEDH